MSGGKGKTLESEYAIDWAIVPVESSKRKSVTSYASTVEWASEQYQHFEQVSFADFSNRQSSRGIKRVLDNGDQFCTDRKRFCRLNVEFVMKTAPSVEGLLEAINENFAGAKEAVKKMGLNNFIAGMTNEETQGISELVLKLHASIEQEAHENSSRMRELVMYNQQKNENDSKERLDRLEQWAKVGSEIAEKLQLKIAEN